MPKVSVIIPTFNRAHYICKTIESVLSQSYQDFEIIIIDDGSTDNTKEALSSYGSRIKYFYQENKGLPAARNLGIRKSNGEYIAFLDSDDLWLPQKLEKQVKVLDKDSELAFVCSESFIIDEVGNIINLWKRTKHNKETFESLYEENFVLVLTVLLRRSCLNKVDLFNETWRICGEYELWLRLVKKYNFKHLDMPLAKYRIHKNNLSKNLDLMLPEHKAATDHPEFAKKISFLRRRIRIAKIYYLFGKHYYNAQQFSKAGFCYLKSVLNCAFIGYYYWPKETESFRFSLFYRILKVYFLIIECLFKCVKEDINEVVDIIARQVKLVAFKTTIISMIPFLILWSKIRKVLYKTRGIKLGLLNIEFFHKDIGVFGGYGINSKNMTDYFNKISRDFKADVLLTRPMPFSNPQIKRLDNADVIFQADPINPSIRNILRYARIINSRDLDLLITMEYYSSYLYSIILLPIIPLILWIHDPRSEEELRKISTSSLAKLTDINIKKNGEDFKEYEQKSLKRIIKLSRYLGRKITFGTTAYCLIEKAKKAYDLLNLNPTFLPTPVNIPKIGKITYSAKPSVCFLGRIDPIKRPWIYFELSKRFKNVEFIVAGKTHFPDIMDPILKKYSNLPNLKFLGLVVGKQKEEILKNTWGIVNTSIHEALPVSFLESLAYGKPIVSCQNPDNLVSKFGIYTGEILGDGMEGHIIEAYSNALEKILSKRDRWKEKGNIARTHIVNFYSFQKFEHILKEIYRKA